MDSANKIISFVLGLVVVIVFFAVITGRIKLKTPNLLFLGKKTTLTPTPTVTPKPNIISSVTIPGNTTQKTGSTTNSNYQPYNKTVVSNNGNLKTIPSTGPGLLLPIAISSLIGGIYIKRKTK